MQSRRRLLRAGLITFLILAVTVASSPSAGATRSRTIGPNDAIYTATPTSNLGAEATVHVTGSQLGDGIGVIGIAQCVAGQDPLQSCGARTTVIPDAGTRSFAQDHVVHSMDAIGPSELPIDCRSAPCELAVFNVFNDFPTRVAGFPLSFVPPPRFHPLAPTRIADSRVDPGAWAGKLGPGGERVLDVAGAGGVPATGVSAAVLNVTVTNATRATHLVVWPADGQLPDTSALNARAGETVASLVTTGLDATGHIQMANHDGEVDVIVDVYGWFDLGDVPGDRYTPISPARLFDSRVGPSPSRLAAGQPRPVPAAGVAGVPADATAVALTVTGVFPTEHTHITAWPSGLAPPTSSTLNLEANDVHANAAVVPVGADGSILFSTNSGETDVVVDVMGWFGPSGSYGFTAVQRRRMYDTRGNPGFRLDPGQTVSVGTLGWSVLPPAKVVLVNTTLITSDHDTHLTVYDAQQDEVLHPRPVPPVSSVNARAGRVASAEVFVGQTANVPAVAVHNNEGHPDVLLDFVGYFS